MQKSDNKVRYQEFVNENSDIPIFLQPWWMDAVCKPGDEWDVIIYEKKQEIKGVLLYYITKKFGFKFIIQPQLTQYNGIWLKYEADMTGNEKLSFEKKVISNLVTQLEKINYAYFNLNFPLQFTNWLPFYWEGFSQTTRYTLQIPIDNPEMSLSRFKNAKKRQINKTNDILHAKIGLPASDFYQLLEKYFGSKGEKVLYSKDFFKKLYTKCKEQNQGEVISVIDKQGHIHAATFVVWDKNLAYNLIPAINPDFMSSGGSALSTYETIKFVSNKVKKFDFEGSMDKGIENSYAQFGTHQVSYFNIKKYNSPIIKTAFRLFGK